MYTDTDRIERDEMRYYLLWFDCSIFFIIINLLTPISSSSLLTVHHDDHNIFFLLSLSSRQCIPSDRREKWQSVCLWLSSSHSCENLWHVLFLSLWKIPFFLFLLYLSRIYYYFLLSHAVKWVAQWISYKFYRISIRVTNSICSWLSQKVQVRQSSRHVNMWRSKIFWNTAHFTW